jgi:hypothetical protein
MTTARMRLAEDASLDNQRKKIRLDNHPLICEKQGNPLGGSPCF